MAYTFVRIPRRFVLGDMDDFLGQVITADFRPRAREIAFNFADLQFVDGAGLTVLCNTLAWLAERDVKLGFLGYKECGPALRYLDDCGFFETYLGEALNDCASCRGTTLPAQKVSHAYSHGWLEYTAAPWLSSKLNTSVRRLATLTVCLKEMFNNIDEHSTEDTGYIHVQHYPNLDKVSITVSDFGIGIPKSIRRKFSVNSDAEAIELASRDGITTKQDSENCGHGLDILVQFVVGRNSGRVSIYSGNGSLHCTKRGSSVRKSLTSGTGVFPGTLIDITFRTDETLYDEDEEEDLQW